MRRFLVWLVVVAGLSAGALAWWVHQPLPLRAGAAGLPLELSIEPGTAPRGVAKAVTEAGVQVPPDVLFWWFRLSGHSRKIRAGSYEIEAGSTPLSLLTMLVRGTEAMRSVTLVEGWTFNQVRDALSKAEQLKSETRGLTSDQIMHLLGRPGQPAEGRFFPDTYTYAKGSSDVAVLRRALHAMDRHLDAAWAARRPDTPLKTPHDALILASIVEKETGHASDRAMVAAVFTNRLRLGMLLQTDPTVIYGLGPRFDGNLRRRDLLADTPYNTYTRAGLPPTPIAMPGRASLMAVAQPAATPALYFVARGDGRSQFSATLEEHNRAVNKYQRGQ